MHPRDSRTHRSTTPRTLALTLALAVVSAGPAVAPAIAQATATYTLDPQGTSHVAWPFTEPTSEWSPLTTSRCHETDDYYAVDWNWGVDDEDRGKTAIAMAPGVVIFAGRNPAGSFGGYGNQVVVHVVDANGDWTDWAYRYAHLDTLAVGDGHFLERRLAGLRCPGSTAGRHPRLRVLSAQRRLSTSRHLELSRGHLGLLLPVSLADRT